MAAGIAPQDPPHSFGTTAQRTVLRDRAASVIAASWLKLAVAVWKKVFQPRVVGREGVLVDQNQAAEEATREVPNEFKKRFHVVILAKECNLILVWIFWVSQLKSSDSVGQSIPMKLGRSVI